MAARSVDTCVDGFRTKQSKVGSSSSGRSLDLDLGIGIDLGIDAHREKALAKPILAQFLELKEELPDHLILFRMGDFYECFFDDAKTVSELLQITLGRRYNEYMCGIPHTVLNRYLQQVLDKKVRVAVCEQHKDMKKDSEKSTVMIREIRRILTPGTVTDEEFLSSSEPSYLVSIASDGKRSKPSFGLVQMDLSTGEIALAPLGSEKELEFNLSRFSAKEVILSRELAGIPVLAVDEGIRNRLPTSSDDSCDADYIFHVQPYELDAIRCPSLGNCCVSFRPEESFHDDNLDSILEQTAAHDLVPLDLMTTAERRALAGALEYGKFVLRDTTPHISACQRNDFLSARASAMEIDPAALKSLEVLQTVTGRKRGSLLHTVDRTITPGGSRLLATNLRAPYIDGDHIQARHDAVEFLQASIEARHIISDHLGLLADSHRSLQRIVDSTWLKRDLAVLAIALHQASALADELWPLLSELDPAEPFADSALALPSSAAELPTSSLLTSVERVRTLRSSHSDLFDAFDRGLVIEPIELAFTKSDALDEFATEMAEEHENEDGLLHLVPGDIQRGYSEELDIARELKWDKRGIVQKKEQEFKERFKVEQLKIGMRRNGMLYIEVPAKEAKHMDKLPELRKLQELRGRSRFRHQELNNLEVDMLRAADKVAALESAITKKLVSQVRMNAVRIREIAEALAEIDVVNSFAVLAEDMNLVRPMIVDAPVAHVSQGRHLVVESQSRGFGGAPRSFVPNPISLAARNEALASGNLAADSARALWLITGPNMGGKSTYLRQNAHIIILAQIGAFVPAREATLGLVDRLFCRVGASDELIADRSTFMVEMEETAAILRRATARSFVIVDEIGRGTSTRDGCAIAQSVLEALVDIGCRTLFATHFHQLPALLAPDDSAMELLKMNSVLDKKTNELIYMYEIETGIADNSYGVHAARLADVPETVLRRTEELLLEFDDQTRLQSSRNGAVVDAATDAVTKSPMTGAVEAPSGGVHIDSEEWSQLSLPQLSSKLDALDVHALSKADADRVIGAVREYLGSLLRPPPSSSSSSS
ncbi:DNA mismatch repair protein MutS [Hondaea fermentalgiana]|uniref:DNA mismatch repair protein MutS n=1 Tax=Hondaea fermentalgiana TaxID=2315210 RepID=A0A2R5G5Z1_9STRA|nr:DNA mismatch repair protein MutS [Hondaea fermentalgiana]|eukprot:GBG23863.1 DNA mismatch repair protein MutS [Hondaea fermentalgiana]